MISDLPPISIGISFYNAEATLLDAVRSVFAQTHQNWELILLDDGSTDRSLELAKSINDPRVRVYTDGENRRLASRLNQIAKLAKYDFIARMDADDLMSPVRIERQLEVLVTHPQVDLVSTGICSLTDTNEPVGIRVVPGSHRITERGLLAGRSGIVHASLVGRRSWFSRNFYNETLDKAQDTNLWVRAYSKDDLNITFISQPLYYYREDGNVTKSRLLSAYKAGRYTIRNDARIRFPLRVRIAEYLSNSVKSIAITLLSSLGQLDYLRGRRNVGGISEEDRDRVMKEIKSLLEIDVPFKDIRG